MILLEVFFILIDSVILCFYDFVFGIEEGRNDKKKRERERRKFLCVLLVITETGLAATQHYTDLTEDSPHPVYI